MHGFTATEEYISKLAHAVTKYRYVVLVSGIVRTMYMKACNA